MRHLCVGPACLMFLVGVTASGVALGEDSVREAPAHDAAARGGIRFCCTDQGTEYLARGRQRVRLPKGVSHWSPDRRLFTWVLSDGRGNDMLGVTDVRGRKRVLLKARRFRRLTGRFVFGAIGWTPDSKRIAFTREVPAGEETEGQLFTISVAGGGETRIPLPPDNQFAGAPFLSPTDDVIALPTLEERPGVFELSTWLLHLDGSTQPRRLIASSTDSVYPEAWAPNGRKLAMQIEPRGLHVVDVATGDAKLVFPGTFYSDVRWAPDSRRLALVVQSRRSEKQDIRVVNADGSGRYDPTRTPKRSSDFMPVWSPDGRRLAFVRNYSTGLDFSGPLSQQPRFKPPRTLVIPAKGGQPRPLRPLRSGEYISDWR